VLFKELKEPTDKRILVLAAALQAGYDIDKLYELTKIDKWFLHKFKNITNIYRGLKEYKGKVIEVYNTVTQFGNSGDLVTKIWYFIH
jgi:hypothetical protein